LKNIVQQKRLQLLKGIQLSNAATYLKLCEKKYNTIFLNNL